MLINATDQYKISSKTKRADNKTLFRVSETNWTVKLHLCNPCNKH